MGKSERGGGHSMIRAGGREVSKIREKVWMNAVNPIYQEKYGYLYNSYTYKFIYFSFNFLPSYKGNI